VINVEEFKELTKAMGKRNKILTVETQLEAYLKATAVKGWDMDFAATVQEGQKLRAACLNYRVERPNSKRRKGIDKVLQLLDVEGPPIEMAARASNSEGAVMARLLMDAREHVVEGMRLLTPREMNGIDQWVNSIISYIYNSKSGMLGKGDTWTPDAQELVIDDMEILQEMSGRESVPGLIRDILKQILNARMVGQISPGLNGVNAKYNETRGSKTKYTLNHNILVDGGHRFRLGSLVHELTHVCVAEAFGNSVLMLSMPLDASDDDYLSVGQHRKTMLGTLLAQVESDSEINSDVFTRSGLKSNLVTQCNYGMSSKLATNYVPNLKTRLEGEEGPDFVPWILGLANRGLGAEIIEYDSVVNQMLVWCFMNNLSPTNPVYVELEHLANEEKARRARGLATPYPVRTPMAKTTDTDTSSDPLPKIGGVKSVGPPPLVH